MSLLKSIRGIKNAFPQNITNEWINSMPRRELTEEEKALPYSKYYTINMSPIPQSDLDIVNSGSIDIKNALPISERNKLLELGDLPTETGYCLMSDGTGYAATKVFMSGVTSKMLDWWFNWHPLVGLRYAIWCPVAHVGISAETPNSHLDFSGVDLHVRNYGKSHYPIEGFNLAGAEKFHIRFYSPESFGLDMNKFQKPNISSLFAAAVTRKVGFISLPIAIFMHCVRELEGGVEYRSRYWLGWTIGKDGKPSSKGNIIPKGIMLSMARNNCIHSLTEYNHLATILPKLYEEENGLIL